MITRDMSEKLAKLTMLANRIRKIVTFELGKEIEKDVFSFCHKHGTKKYSEFPWGNKRSDALPFLRGTYNIIFVPHFWQDEKHLSLLIVLTPLIMEAPVSMVFNLESPILTERIWGKKMQNLLIQRNFSYNHFFI